MLSIHASATLAVTHAFGLDLVKYGFAQFLAYFYLRTSIAACENMLVVHTHMDPLAACKPPIRIFLPKSSPNSTEIVTSTFR